MQFMFRRHQPESSGQWQPFPCSSAGWLGGILLLAAVAASAQTNTLSLAEAKRIAFTTNWDLLAARSGIDAAAAQLIVTKEFPNPTASWSTARIGAHENATVLGNGLAERNYDTIAAISQLLEIAGKRRNRQLAAGAGLRGARARFYDAKRTLDQGVTKAYVAALLAAGDVRIYTESAGYLQHEARIAEERFKAGDLSESDRKQIEINARQYDLQAKAAETAAQQARISVEVLMGVKRPAGQWTPAQALETLGNSTLAAPPVAVLAGAARSDVLAAEADLRAAAANLKLQKAMRVPDPTLQIFGEHNPPGGGPPTDTLGLGISFPLPLWNRNRGNIKAAQANVVQSRIAVGKVRAQAAADIASAEAAYHEAQARWAMYRDELGRKSTEVRQSVAFAYERGGASLVNLLDAERTDNDVRLAAAQAMADTASAVADLAAARSLMLEAELESTK